MHGGGIAIGDLLVLLLWLLLLWLLYPIFHYLPTQVSIVGKVCREISRMTGHVHNLTLPTLGGY